LFALLALVFFIVTLVLHITGGAEVDVIMMDLGFIALAAALVFPIAVPWNRV